MPILVLVREMVGTVRFYVLDYHMPVTILLERVEAFEQRMDVLGTV